MSKNLKETPLDRPGLAKRLVWYENQLRILRARLALYESAFGVAGRQLRDIRRGPP